MSANAFSKGLLGSRKKEDINEIGKIFESSDGVVNKNSDQSFDAMTDISISPQEKALMSNQRKDLLQEEYGIDGIPKTLNSSPESKSADKQMENNFMDRSLINTLGVNDSFNKSKNLLTKEMTNNNQNTHISTVCKHYRIITKCIFRNELDIYIILTQFYL